MKTVLITGTTSGFGKLLVKEFLASGHRVIATGRNLNQREIDFGEHEHLTKIDLDVTSSKEREALARMLEKNGGKLDILVNNAGYGLFGALEDASEAQIRAQMEVNFFGTALLIRELLPFLRASRGTIFNLSSVMGVSGFTLSSLYCASKFAVEGLSESLYYELQPLGVQVCVIEPGGFRTEFTKGAQWARGECPAYSGYLANFKAFMDKISRRKVFQDPVVVARKIVALSQKTKLPLRVPIGKDARATSFVRKVTPEGLFVGITTRVIRKTLGRDLPSA